MRLRHARERRRLLCRTTRSAWVGGAHPEPHSLERLGTYIRGLAVAYGVGLATLCRHGLVLRAWRPRSVQDQSPTSVPGWPGTRNRPVDPSPTEHDRGTLPCPDERGATVGRPLRPRDRPENALLSFWTTMVCGQYLGMASAGFCWDRCAGLQTERIRDEGRHDAGCAGLCPRLH